MKLHHFSGLNAAANSHHVGQHCDLLFRERWSRCATRLPSVGCWVEFQEVFFPNTLCLPSCHRWSDASTAGCTPCRHTPRLWHCPQTRHDIQPRRPPDPLEKEENPPSPCAPHSYEEDPRFPWRILIFQMGMLIRLALVILRFTLGVVGSTLKVGGSRSPHSLEDSCRCFLN